MFFTLDSQVSHNILKSLPKWCKFLIAVIFAGALLVTLVYLIILGAQILAKNTALGILYYCALLAVLAGTAAVIHYARKKITRKGKFSK